MQSITVRVSKTEQSEHMFSFAEWDFNLIITFFNFILIY